MRYSSSVLQPPYHPVNQMVLVTKTPNVPVGVSETSTPHFRLAVPTEMTWCLGSEAKCSAPKATKTKRPPSPKKKRSTAEAPKVYLKLRESSLRIHEPKVRRKENWSRMHPQSVRRNWAGRRMKMRVPGTRLNSKEKRPLLRMEIAGNKVPTLDENCMSSVNCSLLMQLTVIKFYLIKFYF